MGSDPTNITHPNGTSVSPYNEDELEQLRPTTAKPRLQLLGRKIRRKEQTLRRNLAEIGRSTDSGLLAVAVDEQEILKTQPSKYEKVKKINQLQSELETYYSQWESYSEQHNQEVNSTASHTDQSQATRNSL